MPNHIILLLSLLLRNKTIKYYDNKYIFIYIFKKINRITKRQKQKTIHLSFIFWKKS